MISLIRTAARARASPNQSCPIQSFQESQVHPRVRSPSRTYSRISRKPLPERRRRRREGTKSLVNAEAAVLVIGFQNRGSCRSRVQNRRDGKAPARHSFRSTIKGRDPQRTKLTTDPRIGSRRPTRLGSPGTNTFAARRPTNHQHGHRQSSKGGSQSGRWVRAFSARLAHGARALPLR